MYLVFASFSTHMFESLNDALVAAYNESKQHKGIDVPVYVPADDDTPSHVIATVRAR